MTKITRRILMTGAAAAAAGLSTRLHASVPTITAQPAQVQLAPPDYPKTAIWGYDGLAPGPVIRAPRGARLTRLLVNRLAQPTTVHWHGIRIANAMDGVPDLTQDAVAPGHEFLYDFTLPDAGTYWYHPHVRTWEQMARGLSGALIVEEDTPPQVDRDEVLILDDWRLDADAQIDESFGALRDWSHAGRIGNFITVNGSAAHALTAKRHERLRLRLINTANARIFTLGLQGLDGWIVALDGQPLEAPEPIGRIRLAPAQRADLIVDVVGEIDAEAFLISFERDGGYALSTLAIRDQSRPVRLGPPDPLAPNDIPPVARTGDLVRADLAMAGGAMGGMRSALMNGVETNTRTLAGQAKLWAFNGVVPPHSDPLLAARLGQEVRIAMKNETRWPHAMHLHGHHFRQIGASGPGPLRDTLLMDPGADAEIAFIADNPGRWLLHCHMLEHAAAGMSTWIEVG